MPDSYRTDIASTKLTSDMARFLEQRSSELGTTQSDILQRLITHYREACENGLTCPHCENTVEIEL